MVSTLALKPAAATTDRYAYSGPGDTPDATHCRKAKTVTDKKTGKKKTVSHPGHWNSWGCGYQVYRACS